MTKHEKQPSSTAPRNWQARFWTIWIGQAVSLVGSALVRFALSWWLTEQAGDNPVVLTTSMLVGMLPFLFLAPFTGTLVDRWNRRWVMVISDASIALFTALLAILFWRGVAEIWHVYLILFLRAFGDVFQSPAMQASTSLMVPKEQLARVGGMNDMLMGLVGVVAPPLGALLIETVSMQGTLAIDMVTAVMAIAPLLVLRIPQPASDPAKDGTTFWREISEGFSYVWHWKGLFFLFLALALMRFFLAPAFSLLPMMVKSHFGGDVWELSWMNSAHGVGFIAGGVVLGAWGGFKRKTMTGLLGLVGVGIGSLAFGLVPGDAFVLAVGIMFLRTMMVPLIRGSVMAIFQIYVPPALQGRVFTLLLSSITLMAPVGLALGGPVAKAMGIPFIFIVTGVGCLVVAVIWALNPAIRHLEAEAKQRQQSEAAKPA